jgi:hypothetical protein
MHLDADDKGGKTKQLSKPSKHASSQHSTASAQLSLNQVSCHTDSCSETSHQSCSMQPTTCHMAADSAAELAVKHAKLRGQQVRPSPSRSCTDHERTIQGVHDRQLTDRRVSPEHTGVDKWRCECLQMHHTMYQLQYDALTELFEYH